MSGDEERHERPERSTAGAVPSGSFAHECPRPAAPAAPPSSRPARWCRRETPTPTTQRDLGIAYKEMGLYDAAVAEFAKLVDDPDHEVFALTMMGECYEAEGAPAEALLHYKKALNRPQARDEEATQLYYQLGRVFHALGDQSEALYFFEKVARRSPDYDDVAQRVETLRAQGVAPQSAARQARNARAWMRRAGQQQPALIASRISASMPPSLLDRAAAYFQRAPGPHRRRARGDRRPALPRGPLGPARRRRRAHPRARRGGALREGGRQLLRRPRRAAARSSPASLPGEGPAFRATGVSLVLHPRSPHVPTVHANFRRIERGSAGWFGGGADLTPYYLRDEDAVHFHRTLKAASATATTPSLFPRFKAWCDQYFFIPHRGEPRGVGGIFFDYLGAGAEGRPEKRWPPPDEPRRSAIPSALSPSCAAWATPSCRPTCPSSSGTATRPGPRRSAAGSSIRRGRYVEFNLVYDRGTIFGLKTDGRVESILMSLPTKRAGSMLTSRPPAAGRPPLRPPSERQRNWADGLKLMNHVDVDAS